MTDRITTLKIYLAKSFLWWVVIAWIDVATLPATNGYIDWQRIWVALSVIVIGAYKLSWTMPKRWVFIYGCGCSLSFMLRLYSMLQFSSASKSVVAVWLIGLVFTLGFGCYLVALFHAAIHRRTTPTK